MASSEIVSMPPTPVQLPATSHRNYGLVKSELIEKLVAQVSIQTLTESLIALTNINTRQSQSTGAVTASNLLASTYTQFGWNVTRHSFRAGYSDNIIAQITGTVDPTKIVIVGAYYDDRATNAASTTDRAPGANDDGSGTAGLIELARILGTSGLTFPYTLRLISFSGEEQGLYGSTAYANEIKAAGANVIAMLQADMIAYRGNNPLFPLNLGSRYTTPALTDDMEVIARQYVPELSVGRSTNCCSDQQQFFNVGYPAALFMESFSTDPQYHQVGDVINRAGYSIDLVAYITRAVLAGAATYTQVY